MRRYFLLHKFWCFDSLSHTTISQLWNNLGTLDRALYAVSIDIAAFHSVGTYHVMRILKARSALLSDFEVLKVLKEMESEQKAQVNGAIELSEADDMSEDALRNASTTKSDGDDDSWLSKVPENLRTIQYEVSTCYSLSMDSMSSASRN